MPPKTAPALSRAAAPRKSKKKEDAIEIVVRRGALRRFDALKTRTGELPVVVKWDRRTDDRRGGKPAGRAKRDRRQTERRRKPPFTWDVADFLVVEPVKGQKSARRKTSKKA